MRPILAQFFTSLLTIVAEFFPYFVLGIKFKICTVLGVGGVMIGGGWCRIRYVMWMDGLLQGVGVGGGGGSEL